jgi:hypothetical protein
MKVLFQLMILFLLLSACNKEDKAISVTNIEKEIAVTLSQIPSNGKHDPILLFTSLTPNECENTILKIERLFNNSILELNLDGIDTLGTCQEGQHYPYAQYNLQNISQHGQFPMRVSFRKKIENTGIFIFNEKSITLVMNTEDGFLIEQPSIYRIEKGSCYGYYIYPNDSSNQHEDPFQKIINQQENPDFLPTNGNYGVFEVENGKLVTLWEKKANDEAMLFYFSYQNSESLKSAISELKNQYPELVFMLVFEHGEILE